MDKENEIIFCEICTKNKKDVVLKKIGKKFFDVCPQCITELKWTTAVLESGTDWLVNRYPEKYAKFSNISVTPLVST